MRPLAALFLLLLTAAPGCQTPATPQANPPAQAPSQREQAFAAENQGRFGEAADAFLALARQEPGRAEWVVAAGRCLGRSGRFREAIELLDGARQRFPGVLDVPAMLARTLLLQAEGGEALKPEVQWAEAADLAEQVLALEPGHEDARLVLAQARFLLGDWPAAVAAAEEAAKRHPQRPGAHVLLGRIATERLRRLLDQHARERPSGQAAADLVAAIDRERQLATASYRRAAELDPSRGHPHVALGQLQWLDGQPAAARQHFAEALAVDPQVALDHAVFGELDWRSRAGLYQAARQRYLGRPGADPRRAATLQWYEGRALFEGQQWQAARDAFAAALQADPTATNSNYYLALAAYQLGDHDAAERHAASYAAESAPAFADVIRALTGERRGEVGAIVQFLADRAFQQGRLPASRDLNHVIACLKDAADAWNNHAFLCRETGRFQDALASYQHALEKEPDSPQLWNDTAVILHYHLPDPANRTKAKGMYEKALQLAGAALQDGKTPAALRTRAEQAQRDARANLEALAKQGQ